MPRQRRLPNARSLVIPGGAAVVRTRLTLADSSSSRWCERTISSTRKSSNGFTAILQRRGRPAREATPTPPWFISLASSSAAGRL